MDKRRSQPFTVCSGSNFNSGNGFAWATLHSWHVILISIKICHCCVIPNVGFHLKATSSAKGFLMGRREIWNVLRGFEVPKLQLGELWSVKPGKFPPGDHALAGLGDNWFHFASSGNLFFSFSSLKNIMHHIYWEDHFRQYPFEIIKVHTIIVFVISRFNDILIYLSWELHYSRRSEVYIQIKVDFAFCNRIKVIVLFLPKSRKMSSGLLLIFQTYKSFF